MRIQELKVGYLALGLSLLFILLFGILGVGRPESSVAFSDVRFFYTAGTMFLQGDNPYLYEEFKRVAQNLGVASESMGVFAYPPQSLVLWAPLHFLSFDQARWAWTLANLGLLLYSVYGALLMFKDEVGISDKKVSTNELALLACVMIGNPFVMHVIWTGQSSFIILASIIGLFSLLKKGAIIAPALLLAITSIKPQLSLFLFLWMILEGNFKVIATSGIFLVLAIIPSVIIFEFDVIFQWITAATAYQEEVTNGLSYNTNVTSLIAGLGIPRPPIIFPIILGVVTMVFISNMVSKEQKGDLKIISLILISGLFLIYGRDYDIAIIITAFALLWQIGRRGVIGAAIVFGVFVLLFFPQRFAVMSDILILEFRRIVLLAFFWIYTVYVLLFQPNARGK